MSHPWSPRSSPLPSFRLPTSFHPWCPRLELRRCPAAAAAGPPAAGSALRLVAAAQAVLPVAVRLASAAHPLSAVRRWPFPCL